MVGMGIQGDTDRTLLREVDLSLQEWGRWSSSGGVGAGLGYPSTVPWLATRGRAVDDFDMRRVMEVENAITTWGMVVRQLPPGPVRRNRLMQLFQLRMHYSEPGQVSDKIHHLSRFFHKRISRSQYYVLLREARLNLARLIY